MKTLSPVAAHVTAQLCDAEPHLMKLSCWWWSSAVDDEPVDDDEPDDPQQMNLLQVLQVEESLAQCCGLWGGGCCGAGWRLVLRCPPRGALRGDGHHSRHLLPPPSPSSQIQRAAPSLSSRRRRKEAGYLGPHVSASAFLKTVLLFMATTSEFICWAPLCCQL